MKPSPFSLSCRRYSVRKTLIERRRAGFTDSLVPGNLANFVAGKRARDLMLFMLAGCF